jgi:hypothetical protein
METKREIRYNDKVGGYREAEGGKIRIEIGYTETP